MCTFLASSLLIVPMTASLTLAPSLVAPLNQGFVDALLMSEIVRSVTRSRMTSPIRIGSRFKKFIPSLEEITDSIFVRPGRIGRPLAHMTVVGSLREPSLNVRDPSSVDLMDRNTSRTELLPLRTQAHSSCPLSSD